MTQNYVRLIIKSEDGVAHNLEKLQLFTPSGEQIQGVVKELTLKLSGTDPIIVAHAEIYLDKLDVDLAVLKENFTVIPVNRGA